MLVLTRRIGEWIVINNNIYVGIESIDLNRKQVKMMFEAPSHITINRQEIQNRINKEAANDE